jgi:hypothetical protein
MFAIKRNGENYRYTRNELHPKTYFRHKQELLAERPYKGCEFWNENGLNYKLKCRAQCKWKALIDANRCYFLKEQASNPVFTLLKEALQNSPLLPAQTKEIPVFMHLSDTLDIDYENVVCLGTNPQILKNFQKTYQQALAKIHQLPPAEQLKLYKALSPGKPYAVLKNAIRQLQIACGKADLRQMNFSKLIFALKDLLARYRTEALNQAITCALSKRPTAQKLLYQKLSRCTKQEKSAILKELGVNTSAIDVKKFNISPIKAVLAKSLE